LQISLFLAEIASYRRAESSANSPTRFCAPLLKAADGELAFFKNQTNRRIPLVSERIVHITDDSFEQEVLQSSNPVLVDYWADWCGPCKMIAPVLDEIADEYEGKIRIAKLNIDENPNTPPRYGIRGIPTLMLFKDGEVEATKVGAVSKSQLTAFIDSNL
jgi:thioredoxin 1